MKNKNRVVSEKKRTLSHQVELKNWMMPDSYKNTKLFGQSTVWSIVCGAWITTRAHYSIINSRYFPNHQTCCEREQVATSKIIEKCCRLTWNMWGKKFLRSEFLPVGVSIDFAKAFNLTKSFFLYGLVQLYIKITPGEIIFPYYSKSVDEIPLLYL